MVLIWDRTLSWALHATFGAYVACYVHPVIDIHSLKFTAAPGRLAAWQARSCNSQHLLLDVIQACAAFLLHDSAPPPRCPYTRAGLGILGSGSASLMLCAATSCILILVSTARTCPPRRACRGPVLVGSTVTSGAHDRLHVGHCVRPEFSAHVRMQRA